MPDPSPLRRRGRAPQSRGDRDLEGVDRPHHPRRLRADRDGDPLRELSADRGAPRFDGQADAGLRPRRRRRRGTPRGAGQGGRHRDPRGARPAARTLQGVLEEPRGDGGLLPSRVVRDRRSRMTDDDGYFWFVGRADDVIISAGYRIGPFEVESALIEHPAVAEAAAVASPDALRGAIVKAFVVLAPGHEGSDALATELQEHVKRVTAPYKYPREIEFVTDLPKTISGKIRRLELREREAKRKAG